MKKNKKSCKLNRRLYNNGGKKKSNQTNQTNHTDQPEQVNWPDQIDRAIRANRGDIKNVVADIGEGGTIEEDKVNECFENLKEEYTQKYMEKYGREYIERILMNEALLNELGADEYLNEKWILFYIDEIAKLGDKNTKILERRIRIGYLEMMFDEMLNGINTKMKIDSKIRIKNSLLKAFDKKKNNLHYSSAMKKVDEGINILL